MENSDWLRGEPRVKRFPVRDFRFFYLFFRRCCCPLRFCSRGPRERFLDSASGGVSQRKPPTSVNGRRPAAKPFCFRHPEHLARLLILHRRWKRGMNEENKEENTGTMANGRQSNTDKTSACCVSLGGNMDSLNGCKCFRSGRKRRSTALTDCCVCCLEWLQRKTESVT